ncbi:MAG: hypothetical protein FWG03_11370 [Clostridiales bacterium]|nr:hypothetical protein [Clostridiales bacterium]
MPPVIKPRGSGLLRVVSIIMIILGVVSVASGALTAFLGRLMVSAVGLDEFGVRYFQIIGFMALATGAAELIFGILGVRFGGRFDKAGFLVVIGIIQVLVMAFSVLYNNIMASAGIRVVEQIMSNVEQGYGASAAMGPDAYAGLMGNPWLTVINFILPALFIIGALLNRLPPKVLYAPGQYAPGQNAPVQYAPGQNAPVQYTPEQNEPEQNEPVQNAPGQNAPEQNEPVQNAPGQNAPEQNQGRFEAAGTEPQKGD